MRDPLDESRRLCRRIARSTGRNFYWSFLTLPRPLYRDMCVLYAFMRITDDIGDDESLPLADRRERLVDWRRRLSAALDGDAPAAGTQSGPPAASAPEVLPALQELVRRRAIPGEYLFDVIDGVASDLTPRTFATFAELDRYCYQVAGAVGLCCIHVWGFRGEEAPARAVECGTAFQLTNILRDLVEDSRRGRVYLPREDLERFGVTGEALSRGDNIERVRELLAFEAARAREYYRRGAALLPCLERPGRAILATMFRIYRGLLDEIERRGFDVFTQRVELSRWSKLRAAVGGWWRPTL